MSILLIDNGTTLLKKLEQLIPGKEVVHTFQDFPEDLTGFDLAILSGGSKFQLMGNEEKFSKEIDFIKNSNIPIIGICLGFEIIALAYGAILRELAQNKSEIYEIEIIEEDLSRRKINVCESHKWVVDTLPDIFEILAISEDGPEIIKHKTKPIYGLQFHPENMVDETEGDELFLRLFGKLLKLK
jgi:GMP synthase (glutamine-hydrolysing)